MDKIQSFDNLLKEISQNTSIPLTDIPDIDLYMDQVTTFIDEKLKDFKRTPEDKILTKTMINNYTKNDLLPPPVKKKYSKEHMVLLILIYHMKHVLSIGDIQSLLFPIVNKIDTQNNTLEDIYSIFLQIQKESYANMPNEILQQFHHICEIFPDSELEDQDQLQLLVMALWLIIQSSIQKQLAEKMIDTFFLAKKEKQKK